MAKGDMGNVNPNNLAMIVSRLKSAQGGGQMGPGQFGGGMMPNMPLPPSAQNRPMIGNFISSVPGLQPGNSGSVGQAPIPNMKDGSYNPMQPPGIAPQMPQNNTFGDRGISWFEQGEDGQPVKRGRLGTESNLNTGIGGLGRSSGKLQYFG
jgi:hypothetical protein